MGVGYRKPDFDELERFDFVEARLPDNLRDAFDLKGPVYFEGYIVAPEVPEPGVPMVVDWKGRRWAYVDQSTNESDRTIVREVKTASGTPAGIFNEYQEAGRAASPADARGLFTFRQYPGDEAARRWADCASEGRYSMPWNKIDSVRVEYDDESVRGSVWLVDGVPHVSTIAEWFWTDDPVLGCTLVRAYVAEPSAPSRWRTVEVGKRLRGMGLEFWPEGDGRFNVDAAVAQAATLNAEYASRVVSMLDPETAQHLARLVPDAILQAANTSSPQQTSPLAAGFRNLEWD